MTHEQQQLRAVERSIEPPTLLRMTIRDGGTHIATYTGDSDTIAVGLHTEIENIIRYGVHNLDIRITTEPLERADNED